MVTAKQQAQLATALEPPAGLPLRQAGVQFRRRMWPEAWPLYLILTVILHESGVLGKEWAVGSMIRFGWEWVTDLWRVSIAKAAAPKLPRQTVCCIAICQIYPLLAAACCLHHARAKAIPYAVQLGRHAGPACLWHKQDPCKQTHRPLCAVLGYASIKANSTPHPLRIRVRCAFLQACQTLAMQCSQCRRQHCCRSLEVKQSLLYSQAAL